MSLNLEVLSSQQHLSCDINLLEIIIVESSFTPELNLFWVTQNNKPVIDTLNKLN